MHYFASIHRKVHFGRFLVSASSCAVITLLVEIQQTLEKSHVRTHLNLPPLPKLLNGGLKLKLLLVVVACLGFSYFSHEGPSRSEIGAVIEAVPIS